MRILCGGSPLISSQNNMGGEWGVTCRGDTQERREFVLSFSPLFLLDTGGYGEISCRGETQERRRYYNSRSPLMNRFLPRFNGPVF